MITYGKKRTNRIPSQRKWIILDDSTDEEKENSGHNLLWQLNNQSGWRIRAKQPPKAKQASQLPRRVTLGEKRNSADPEQLYKNKNSPSHNPGPIEEIEVITISSSESAGSLASIASSNSLVLMDYKPIKKTPKKPTKVTTPQKRVAGKKEESWFEPLISLSLTPSIQPFDTFIDTSKDARSYWVKIGEATFSEVFMLSTEWGEDFVVKVVPVAEKQGGVCNTDGKAIPLISAAASIYREIEISSLLAQVDGFVPFCGSYLVKGRYPNSLLKAWDCFKKQQDPPCDDQIRPDILDPSQMYAVLCLQYKGEDLEKFRLQSWGEAWQVLKEVSRILSVAEQSFQFEHRDLHWGNILLKRNTHEEASSKSSHSIEDKLGHLSLKEEESSIEVTLIDFTLSRATLPDQTLRFDTFADDDYFTGEGDLQFDIYRKMKKITKGNWEGFFPITNVMWLYYLSDKLLNEKNLTKPKRTQTDPAYCKLLKAHRVLNASMTKSKTSFQSAVEVVEWLD